VQHSLANIQKAADLIGYHPGVSVKQGLGLAFEWYRQNLMQLADEKI
jgi:UDP-N-acetylglucosamine 4-epimerase